MAKSSGEAASGIQQKMSIKTCIENPLNVTVPWLRFLRKNQKPDSVFEMVNYYSFTVKELISEKGYYYRMSLTKDDPNKPPAAGDCYCEIKVWMEAISPVND